MEFQLYLRVWPNYKLGMHYIRLKVKGRSWGTSLIMLNVCWLYVLTVRDTDNLHFSADMPQRFSEGSRAAIRWCPRGNMRTIRAAMRGIGTMQRTSAMNAEAYVLDWRQVSIVESLQSRYRWGSIQLSAILSHASMHNVCMDTVSGHLECLL